MKWTEEDVEAFAASKRADVEARPSGQDRFFHSLLIGSEEEALNSLAGLMAYSPGDCGAIFKATTGEKVIEVLENHPEISFVHIQDVDAPPALYNAVAAAALKRWLQKPGVTLDAYHYTPELNRILDLPSPGREGLELKQS